MGGISLRPKTKCLVMFIQPNLERQYYILRLLECDAYLKETFNGTYLSECIRLQWES